MLGSAKLDVSRADFFQTRTDDQTGCVDDRKENIFFPVAIFTRVIAHC